MRRKIAQKRFVGSQLYRRFTMSTNLFPIVSGMLGPTVWGLNLRDSCLTILFFNLLCTHIPAYL